MAKRTSFFKEKTADGFGEQIDLAVKSENVIFSDGELLEKKLQDKISTNELDSSINKALELAKESGDFNGPAGKTPEKGVDYYTEQDKTEMVNAVIAALPTWTGGAY